VTGPVLVVQHEDDCPPAWFGTWMTEAGATLDVRKPYAGQPLPDDLTGHSGLLVLGGAMNAIDEVVTPWLGQTKALVREAAAGEVALLGICLGHQVVADALGGTVEVNANGRQRGLLAVGWNAQVGEDPLVGTRPAQAAHWNGDVVTVAPAGAVVLANAPGGEIQALRFGSVAWGLQSHPEVDEQILASWAVDEPPSTAAEQRELEEFLAQVAAARASLAESRRPVATAFARLCRG